MIISHELHLLILIFILISGFLVLFSKEYNLRTKFIKLITRGYLWIYFLTRIVNPFLDQTHIHLEYGIIIFFLGEIFMQWMNQRYGR